MGRKLTDLSQLKKFSPPAPPPEPPRPVTDTPDHKLAGATDSTDYFSSLLGGKKAGRASAGGHAPKTTLVTPATIAKVREEQTAAAFAAERESLLAELEAQKAATDALAAELVTLKDAAEAQDGETTELRAALETEKAARAKDAEAAAQSLENVRRELSAARAELAEEKSKPRLDESLLAEAETKDKEIARLQALLTEAQRTSLSSSVLLEKPAGLGEKFPDEIREHVLDTLKDARTAAEQSGRERRGRILEAVLCANAPSGELDRRRAALKKIIQDAGSFIDESAIAALEKLGFRYISGNKHHKLDWAGIRFSVSKTPSDYRGCRNSATEISNRVF